MSGVRYIGKRATWEDAIYGSWLVFEKGQSRNVPSHLANKFLRHYDIFEKSDESVDDDTALILEQSLDKEKQRDEVLEQLLETQMRIEQMDKDSVHDYVLHNYREKMDKRQSIEKMREHAIMLINQFGVV
jgi:hypothetical protein